MALSSRYRRVDKANKNRTKNNTYTGNIRRPIDVCAITRENIAALWVIGVSFVPTSGKPTASCQRPECRLLSGTRSAAVTAGQRQRYIYEVPGQPLWSCGHPIS